MLEKCLYNNEHIKDHKHINKESKKKNYVRYYIKNNSDKECYMITKEEKK